jgi:hypothetical protein
MLRVRTLSYVAQLRYCKLEVRSQPSSGDVGFGGGLFMVPGTNDVRRSVERCLHSPMFTLFRRARRARWITDIGYIVVGEVSEAR